MIYFQQFYLDREKDIAVELYLDGERMEYLIRTPNGRLATDKAHRRFGIVPTERHRPNPPAEGQPFQPELF